MKGTELLRRPPVRTVSAHWQHAASHAWRRRGPIRCRVLLAPRLLLWKATALVPHSAERQNPIPTDGRPLASRLALCTLVSRPARAPSNSEWPRWAMLAEALSPQFPRDHRHMDSRAARGLNDPALRPRSRPRAVPGWILVGLLVSLGLALTLAHSRQAAAGARSQGGDPIRLGREDGDRCRTGSRSTSARTRGPPDACCCGWP